MSGDRFDLYREFETLRNSKILVYITGDRKQLETQISSETIDLFVHHLDLIEGTDKISLYLYTRGGLTLSAWSISNLIKQFCKEFEVIVPSKALSAGTLLCLGAKKIVMTKQATLGPIDPSVNTPLNPQIPGAPPTAKMPVSVEALNGYLDFAKEALGEKADLTNVILTLSNSVHPLVLGESFRARNQIKTLARKLLARQIDDESRIKKILDFLCSESGSHDYTIDRKEAREDLGLEIESPDDEFYAVIKKIYDNISGTLELTKPYDPVLILGSDARKGYSFKRALIESVSGGSHCFVSEGELSQRIIQTPDGGQQRQINDSRSFEGWRHENV